VIDFVALQMVLRVLTGWLDRRERKTVAYLIEENRLLWCQLGGRRLRLTDEDRPGDPDGAVSWPRSVTSSCGWRRRIRRGVTRGFRARNVGHCAGRSTIPPDPESGGPAARSGAPDIVADVFESALGRHRWGRFLTTEVWNGS
jgi:hypothetical protein